MEELEHSLFIVEFFNKIFGKPLSLLLGLVGIEVKHPEHLVPDYIVMSLIVAAILILVFGLASRNIKPIPSKMQSFCELIIETFENLLVDTIGEEGKKYLPMMLVESFGHWKFTIQLAFLFLKSRKKLKEYLVPCQLEYLAFDFHAISFMNE